MTPLREYIRRLGITAPVYEDSTHPQPEQILRAVELCPANKTKVIILGQDPYATPDAADGLAFSVAKGKPISPSLRNILLEAKSDVGIDYPESGDLTAWAKQGVLLLNRILTVEEGKPSAHRNLGWERLTAMLIQDVLEWRRPLVIMAWGVVVQEGIANVEINPETLLLTGGHPSPLNSREPFRGGRYFSKANEWLKAHGVAPVDWRLK